MSTPSGWYDDPEDPTNLRYWDGVVWTDHRTPKTPPAPAPTPMPPTAQLPVPPPAPGGFGGYPSDPTAPSDLSVYQQTQPVQPVQPPPVASSGWGTPGYGAPPTGYGAPPAAPGSMPPAAPPVGWPPYGAQGGPTWGFTVPSTPDGVPLASLGTRLGARIIDWILMGIIVTPFVAAPMRKVVDYFTALFDEFSRQIDAGLQPAQPTATELMNAIGGPVSQISLTMLFVGLVYESSFLLLRGATPGKMILGIGVRLRERPGRLPIGSVLLRQVIWAVNYIPFASALGIVNLLDALWPLWDSKKQALHDKLAKTQVVRTR